VTEYDAFCKRIFKKPDVPLQPVQQPSDNENPTINGVLNPFEKESSNEDLSFLGRDSQNPLAVASNPKPMRYKRDTIELYGPVWIFITLIVEFVILGHMTNSMQLSVRGKGKD
jgi:hypothetical protein